jgi:DNA-damage-inducible protein J
MAQSNLNIRIDEDVKKQSEELFADLGMNMTTAINVFLRQSIRKRGIPFEISAFSDGFYNEFNQKRLDKAIADLKAGKGKQHELIEADGD